MKKLILNGKTKIKSRMWLRSKKCKSFKHLNSDILFALVISFGIKWHVTKLFTNQLHF